jgi:hypothetical protein
MSKRACAVLAGAVLASVCTVPASAVVLWNNGGYVTNPTGGTGTIAGQPISQIQLPSTTFGFGLNEAAVPPVRLADDFTVGGPGWDLDTVTVHGYLTGATVPTATSVRLELFNGAPASGGTSLGVQTVPAGPGTLIAYRQTSTGTSDSTRRVFAYTVSMDGFANNGQLAPGTYWLAYSLVGASFVPPVTPRETAPNLNGQQFVNNAWAVLDDDPGTATLGAAIAFQLDGTVVPEPASLSVLAVGALATLRRRRR